MPLKDDIPTPQTEADDFARNILKSAKRSFSFNRQFINTVQAAKDAGLTNQQIGAAIDAIIPSTASELAPYYTAIKNAVVAFDSNEVVPDL